VTSWYGLSNPFSWAAYLSVGVEIAALSALAAISAQMGSKVYFPFGIVTLIQFIGNIFFAYQYIDINSQAFKDWVDLVDPLVSYLGVESGDYVGHKRFLSLFAGGMLPIISLSFLHMLVKFEEDEKKKGSTTQPQVVDIDQLSIQAGKMEAQIDQEKYTPSKEELERLEDELRKLNEQKFGALQPETVVSQNPREMMLTNDSDIIESIPSDDEISDWDVTLTDGLEDESDFFEDESPLYESEKKSLSYVRSHG
jgi:spermidine/putrescine-binding protein